MIGEDHHALVVIQTYNYAHESGIARGLLESEGIETFMQDEVISQVLPYYANAAGGIKLLVKSVDYDKALELLFEKGLAQSPVIKNEKFEGITSSEQTYIQADTAYRKILIKVVLAGVIIYLLLELLSITDYLNYILN